MIIIRIEISKKYQGYTMHHYHQFIDMSETLIAIEILIFIETKMKTGIKLNQKEIRFIQTYSEPPKILLTIKNISEQLNIKFWEKEILSIT